MHALSLAAPRALLIALIATALAGGCATLDKDECRSADWRTIGFTDGARGHLPERIDRYRRDCAEHGVTPDLDAWMAGRDDGLLEYCRERNGYRVGNGGKAYQGVCPRGLEARFLTGYRVGRELYELRAEVTRLERDIDERETALADLNEELQQAETELVSDGVSRKRRTELLTLTRELAKGIGAAESELAARERGLAVTRNELDAALRRNPY